MAGLRIGNKGYSFFELLVTVMVLSVGIIYLFPAFFKSGSTLAYLNTRYEANIAIHNLLTKVEEERRSEGGIERIPARGLIDAGQRKFEYEISFKPVFIYYRRKLAAQTFLYQVDARVHWSDATKGQLTRTTYVIW